MSVAWRIAPGGRITEHAILPQGLAIAGGECTLQGGAQDEHWQSWSLPAIAEIITRVAPWCECWCGPEVIRDGVSWGGYASKDRATLAVASSLAPVNARAAAYHETGHAVHSHLVPKWRVVMDSVAVKSRWPGDYFGDPEEQCARFVEHIAMALDHGAEFLVRPGSPTELATEIYLGNIGKQVVAAKLAATLPPPSLARRILRAI